MIGLVNRSRTVITAMSLMSVLALGACSDDDPEPELAPPSSSAPSSPSTTAVSGPIEPTMPAAARGTDAAAAEAFVRFYWEMVNYAQATGDVRALTKLSEDCPACRGGVTFIKQVYARGGRLTGGVGRIHDARVGILKGPPAKRLVVHFRLENTTQVEDYPGSRRDKTYPGGTIDFQVMLESVGRGWTVVYMGEE